MPLLNKTVEKMLDVLLDHPNVGYSKKELAEAAGISRSALYNVWNVLEDNGIVIKKKKYGGTTLYRLNPNSEIVNHIGRLMDEIVERKEKKAVEI